jgi:transcriptional regulator
MLAGIVAFELRVEALECKVKLNQHRPESHAALRNGYARGNEQERQLAQWMDSLGIGEPHVSSPGADAVPASGRPGEK